MPENASRTSFALRRAALVLAVLLGTHSVHAATNGFRQDPELSGDAQPAHQITGTPGNTTEADDDDDSDRRPTPRARSTPLIAPPDALISEAITQLIVTRIEDSRDLCERVPRKYVVDCLAKQLGALADELPSAGELAPAQATLDRVARELAEIARANRDRREPRIRAEIPGVVRTPAPLIAVRPDRAAVAERAAEGAIAEASTILLRSAAGAETVASSYTRIAGAVDSTKLLLRSS